jgi:hypothetical protein
LRALALVTCRFLETIDFSLHNDLPLLFGKIGRKMGQAL